MKPLSIIGLFLFALAACTQRAKVPEPVEGPSPELSAIDSLMWSQPDSALLRLLPWFDTCCRDAARHVSTATAYNRHHANLLLSELLYKNDYPQTNRKELQQAVNYFDSLTVLADTRGVSLQPRPRRDARRASVQNIAFLDARVHYINGVGYYENDSVVEACKEYMKALDVMEGHFEEKELVEHKARLMALTYTHLTSLFSDMYLHEQAIYFGKESLKYYQKHNAEPWHIAWILNEIGSRYDILDNCDSAYYYYGQGIKILSDTNSLIYRDIATHLACLSYKKGENTTKSLNKLNFLINKANGDKEYYSRCLTIGEIFYHEKQYDSARYYYNKVFYYTRSEESKKLAAERLIEICKVQEKELESSEYVDFLLPFANQEEIKSAVKSQLTELYKSFDQRRLEQMHRHEKKKNLKWTIGIIIGFFVSSLVIAILYRKNKKKRQLLEIQIKEEQHTHTVQQKSLSERLKQKNQEVRELKDQIKQQNDRDVTVAPTISFDEEPICRLIMDRVKEGQFKSQMDCTLYKGYALTKEQIMALHEAVNRHFVGFTVCLKKKYPQLTDSDLNYCSLYLY